MTIKNQYNLEVDLKHTYTGVIPSFAKNDTNEIIIKVLDNGKYFNLDTVEAVVVTYKNVSGKLVQENCKIINLNNQKAILIEFANLDIHLGFSKLTITLSESNYQVTLPEIKVVVREVIKVSIKHWTDFIAKIESENPVEIKKDFNIKSIPLQLLTKVNCETTNKEIDSILTTIKSIELMEVYDTSDEGKELRRIEKVLEDRITTDVNDGNYKSLENSVRLLQRVKSSYRIVVTSGVVGGRIK